MKQQIAEVCKKLRLSKNIAENCGRIQAESNEEHLLKVLQQELFYRETVRKSRLLKQAGFYTLKTFDGYCFDEIRMPANLEIDDLKQANFIEQKKNLILYGNVGAGKTHMAIALGVTACA
ncbi:MAG: ATP-binding protein, partial [Desulfotomaculaceae bacterium]|nr:ATP-binding protein [Desulfotomaculaceae bacterium]